MDLKQRFKTFLSWETIEDLSFVSGGRLFVIITGFLYGVVGARILGPEGFGQLVLVMSLVRVSEAPFNFRLDRPLVKLVGQQTAEDDDVSAHRMLVSTGLVQGISLVLFTVLLVLVVLTVSPHWDLFSDWQTAIGYFALSEIFHKTRTHLKSFFKARKQFANLGTYESLSGGMRDFGPILFMPWGVTATCFGYLASEVVLVILTVPFFLPSIEKLLPKNVKLTWNQFREDVELLYRHARSNYLHELIAKFYTMSQSLILGQFTGKAEVGYFNIGKKVLMIFRVISMPVSEYLYPRLIESWEKNREDFFRLLRKYFYVAIPGFITLALCLIPGAPFVWWILYGSEFSVSVMVVYIFLPVAVFYGTFNVFAGILFASSDPRQLLNMSLIDLLLGLPLALVLTYHYSYLGMSLAVVARYLALYTYEIIYLFNRFGIRWIYPVASEQQ